MRYQVVDSNVQTLAAEKDDGGISEEMWEELCNLEGLVEPPVNHQEPQEKENSSVNRLQPSDIQETVKSSWHKSSGENVWKENSSTGDGKDLVKAQEEPRHANKHKSPLPDILERMNKSCEKAFYHLSQISKARLSGSNWNSAVLKVKKTIKKK
mmetsp:Transcript_33643/g.75586  ORF Transcript_33643/g.75586 Transcript_33643/m.75586 type:complete len:154 (+) Transcript_33643:744-1205(+)